MATICDKCGGNLLYSPVRKAMYCKLCGSTFKAEEIQDVSKADLIDKKILSFKELTGVDDRDLYNCNVYTCNHCGADILINGKETSTLCMFCGSPNIVFSRIAKQHKPEGIIPFTVSKEEAATILKARFKNAKFIPSELRRVKTENIRGIYIPYWVVNASFYSAYTIKTTEQQGKHHYNYYYCRAASTEFKSMPFDASTRLNDMLSRSLEPFWFEDAKVFDEDYLNGFYSDQSDLTPQGLRTAALKRMNDMVGQEVGQTDGSDLPLVIQVLQCPPGLGVEVFCLFTVLEIVSRPVDQVKIKIVHPKRLQAGIKGSPRLVVAPVGVPDLAGDKEALPGKPALPDGLAYPLLIFIEGSGINVAVSCLDGGGHRGFGFLSSYLIRPIADAGNGDAVVQGECVVDIGEMIHTEPPFLFLRASPAAGTVIDHILLGFLIHYKIQ